MRHYFFCCLFLASFLHAQDTISYTKLAVVGGGTLGGLVYGYALQDHMWWKGEKSTFHSEWTQDWTYAMGSDKIGHAFFPYLVSRTYTMLLTGCGLDTARAVWYSSGFALAYQSFIEVRDGFSAEWGFSWGDFGADVIGAGLPVLQLYYPALNDYSLKISYYPSDRFRNDHNKYIMDDYESTYHWLSINPRAILPEIMSTRLPKWLHLAIGHSVAELENPSRRTHQLFISVDWNLEGIETGVPICQKIFRVLNHYHLPAPAIMIYPRFAGFLFHF